jgi:uncharacterized protein
MIVDIRELKETSGSLSADEAVSVSDPFGENVVVDCHVDLSYVRSGSSLAFRAVVAALLPTRCQRCLTAVSQRIEGSFDVLVRKASGGGADETAQTADADDVVTLALDEYEVSFDQTVYETLMVNIPMQIVCRDDCRGLCPQCGADLNVGPCSCERPADPRWDALRKLKNK